ncbi:MAG: NADPH-dependent FMN reductase [Pseudomonadales bacterium]
MKILAFAASNSTQSINRQLLGYASTLIEGAEIEMLDINDYEMPLYSSDREAAHGIPDEAQRFYQKIGAADALLISFAEHNGSYTAAYKNLYDWTSRIDAKVYQSKPTVMLSTSPGAGGAANVLATATKSAPFFGADLRASMSVPSFIENFDTENRRLSDSGLVERLRATVLHLADAVA